MAQSAAWLNVEEDEAAQGGADEEDQEGGEGLHQAGRLGRRAAAAQTGEEGEGGEEEEDDEDHQVVAPSPAGGVCRGREEPVQVDQEIRRGSRQGAEAEGEDGVEEEKEKSDQVATAGHSWDSYYHWHVSHGLQLLDKRRSEW